MRPEILNPMFAPVSRLEGIGPKLEKNLTRLFHGNDAGAVARVQDLLFHIPHSVIDRRLQPGIANAPEGVVVTLNIHVDRHQPPPRGNRRVPYRVFAHDETGEMTLVFFHAHGDWISKLLPVGERRYVSGRAEWFNGQLNIVHPDHVVGLDAFDSLPLVEPVYPMVAGVSAKVLARSIDTAVSMLPGLPEWIDHGLLERQRWPAMGDALRMVHQPRDSVDIDPNSPQRRRLAYDELLSGQLALAIMRERLRKQSGKAQTGDGRLADPVLARFGYPLTPSQEGAITEIRADMAKPERMLRLLQGDVGAGKTIVALMAMATACEAGNQAAIMAPTEILARQHLASITALVEGTGIRVEILTGREKGAKRKAIYEGLENGDINMVIGTHALFQSGVHFASLGLVVIDEQHRFGVHQRLALGEKGLATDVLVMTATPIPRTLVLTYFGDMDVSKLTGKPAGRQPIQTSLLPLEKLGSLVERCRAAVADGKKIYWICPLVEESEEVKATAAEDRYKHLQSVFPEGSVGLVHGRMASEEKEAAMAAFKSGETRLLVATTVIEVGVDVPDATIMIIEHAERFGLSQLHQLRGRVGRGREASSCILLYKSPVGEVAQARLKIMRESEDGFRIAEEDLKLRGEGEVLGTRQSGLAGFHLADMEFHGDVLEMARDQAKMVMATNNELQGSSGEALRIMLYLFGQDQAIRFIRSG